MPQLTTADIEERVAALKLAELDEEGMYSLLLAYGKPQATVTRLKSGQRNMAKLDGHILLKGELCYALAPANKLQLSISEMRDNPDVIRHKARFLVASAGKTFAAYDTKTNETLDIPTESLLRHYDFFLPWSGLEKYRNLHENVADRKAAERMAKLFDELKKNNHTTSVEEIHSLNVFLSRLLFCFFAEDTGIFKKHQFTKAISSHTRPDGSDLHLFLDRLFEVLNQERREGLPSWLEEFDYVNGGLFQATHASPRFNASSRATIIHCGELDWAGINPDIFGSMIQAVVGEKDRSGLGMHYTSVPNIMKVLEPLFLTELRMEFEAAENSPIRLHKLLESLSRIKVFDPACGSGNFLIIAYKELRGLEINILKRLQELQQTVAGFNGPQTELILIPKKQQTLAASFQVPMFSCIELSQFYGIELDDFAHEVALLSLWLAKHQLNIRFKEVMGTASPLLPLRDGGNIRHGNATHIDWNEVCPYTTGDEIYLIGNPPYLGYSLQKNSIRKTWTLSLKE